ncbi:MAG TPA: PH domain-containing protein [Alphaproteobacteria bacterium]|nr:PH domain-containing protein [Alphaproteobacteria bacterium]
MSFISRSLGPTEQIVARAHFHWLYTARAVLALVFLGIILIGIYIFIAMLIKKGTTEIAVTNRRFIFKTGLFRLDAKEFTLSNIEGVQVHQGFFGRIFNYGKLTIEGTGEDHYELPTIADPVGFARAIETAKELADRR